MVKFKATTMSRLLLLSTLSSLLMCGVNAQALRARSAAKEEDRNLQYGIEPLEGVVCRLELVDAQFADGTEQETYFCSLDDGQQPLGGKSYNINLTEDFLDFNRECIITGACFVEIPGGQVVEGDSTTEPTIQFPEGTEMKVTDESESDRERRRSLETGNNPVLVVRVTAPDQSVGRSRNQIAGSVFGRGSSSLSYNMASQYYACSHGKLEMTPVTGSNGVDIVNGVIDVTIDKKATGSSVFSLRNKMYDAAAKAVGSNLSQSPRHIMYCVPYGTDFNGSLRWVAFATVRGFNSWYNDEWCYRLSAQVHEIGHNLGLKHSNENGSYRDQTGLMGYSYSQSNGPRMCFNAIKHYQLGWYDGQTEDVNPSSNGPWTGDLVAFTDAASAPSKTVIVRITTGNIYAQFNRAKGMNKDTREKRDQVIFSKQSGDESEAINGGLASPGDTLSLGGNIEVELCEMRTNSGSYDYARISIYRANNQASGCSGARNSAIQVTGFTLVDTEHNLPWSYCAANACGNNLSILVQVAGPVKSVKMWLEGESSHEKTENVAPYALFGDGGWGDIRPGNLPSGSYRIRATAYPENHGIGLPSEDREFSFSLK